MNISIRPGKDRKDHFYAIKDVGTGNYIGCTWNDKNGQEVCTWFCVSNKVAKIAGNEDRARSRLRAVIDKMVMDHASVSANPPSWWKDENLKLLNRLLNGDMVLVRIEIDLKVGESPV